MSQVPQLRRVWKSLGLIAWNIIVVFLLLELTCIIFGIPYSSSKSEDPDALAIFDKDRGWSFKPSFSTIRTTGQQSSRIQYHFNKDGIRVSSNDTVLSKQQPSVLFIGGSFTAGDGVNYEQSIPGIFQTLIPTELQVINLGVNAYGTDQSFLTLQKFISQFNTRLVIYSFIPRHLYRIGNRDRRLLVGDHAVIGTKPVFSLSSEGQLFLRHKARLLQDYWNSRALDLLAMGPGRLLGLFPPLPVQVTVSLIHEMKSVSEKAGARFILVRWKGFWEFQHPETVEEVFKKVNIPYLTLTGPEPEGWEAFKRSAWEHPNAEANRFAAMEIQKFVEQQYPALFAQEHVTD